MSHTTQLITSPPGLSMSVTVSANVATLAGAPKIVSGGIASTPSQVYGAGIAPLSLNARLVSRSEPGGTGVPFPVAAGATGDASVFRPTGVLAGVAGLVGDALLWPAPPQAARPSMSNDATMMAANRSMVALPLVGYQFPTRRSDSLAPQAAGHAMAIEQSTEDAREGPRAFAEKREPQLKGR